MILDERNEFADATALGTSGTGRQLVGDVIDLGKVSQDIGNGEPLYLVVQVDTAVTSDGSATVSFELASDAHAAIATNGTATVHVVTPAIAKTALTAGVIVAAVALPMGTYERYLGIIANVGAAAVTAGKINAFLTKDVAKWVATADAVN